MHLLLLILLGGFVTVKACPHDQSRCKWIGPSGWPGQCGQTQLLADYEYSCFDRSDSVDPFEAVKTVDFAKMKPCNNMYGTEGYMCNGICRGRNNWCQSRKGTFEIEGETCFELDGIGLNDLELCGNFTFWSTAPQCGRHRSYRCLGRYNGQCASPPDTYRTRKPIFGTCDDEISINQCFYGPRFSFVVGDAFDPCFDNSHLVQRKCEVLPENTTLYDIKECTLPESKCNAKKHDHCKNVCGWDDEQKIAELEKIRKKYPDSSDICSFCHKKTICPKPDYFVCEENDEAKVVAIHPDLKCDQLPQCMNIEDERNCFDEYRKKRFTKPNAEFVCDSIRHPNVQIEAVRCDGKAECFDSIDEAGCKISILRLEILAILIAIVILSYFVPYIFRELFSLKAKDLKLSLEIENDKIYNKIIAAKSKKERRNLFLKVRKMHRKESDLKTYRKAMLSLEISTMKDEDKDILYALTYRIEAKIHRQSKKEVHLCLMKNQSNLTSRAILDSVYPGIFTKCLDNSCTRFINRKWNKMMENYIFNNLISIVNRLVKVTLFYVDLLKDSFIILTLINIVGPKSVFTDLTVFSHQIIFVLLLSVLFPIYCSSIRVALKYPFVLFGYESYYSRNDIGIWKTRTVQVLIFLLAPLVPALLIDLAEKERNNLKKICQRNSEDESILKREEFMNLLKKLVLDVKKLELCVEVPIQIIVPLIMILLEKTKTKTVSGLEAVFKTDPIKIPYVTEIDPETLLIISIIMSLKTAIFTFLKMKSIERDSFVPFFGKIILFIRAFLVLSARFTSYILFFTPFLGLGSILAHHTVERFPFKPPDSISSNDTFFYWHNKELQTVPWTKLFKHYTATPHFPATPVPSYTDYTGMSLQEAYVVFWALLVFQIAHTVILKSFIYRNVPDSDTISLSGKLRHCFDSIHLPDVMKDWDKGSLSLTDCEVRWYKIRLEIFFASLLQWISNCVLTVPVIFVGLRIKARHELLVAAIGVRDEEQDSYETALLLIWVPTLAITIVSILEFCLFLLYNRFGHPWKELLKEDDLLEWRMCEDEEVDEEVDEEFTEKQDLSFF